MLGAWVEREHGEIEPRVQETPEELALSGGGISDK
jgi:hypothetical protein